MRLMFSSGAGYSHLAPMVPLAVAARDAGDDVVFVTGQEAVRYGQDTGVPTVAIGRPREPGKDAAMWQDARAEMATMTPQERLSHIIAKYMVGLGAAARLDDMLEFVRSWKPDLVVTNLAERAAVMAAGIAHVPYVMHGIGPPKTADTMAQAWQVAQDIVRPYGLDRLPPREQVPYLDIWPDGLHPDGVAWEYPTLWPLQPAGVMPEPGARPAVLEGLPHERTVYVTLGTTHNSRPGVLETMVSALRAEDVNVVVTIGRDGDRTRFGDQPDNVRIEHFVPQQRLLPAVDAVVCHGGSATVLGALAHGVPLVVAPLATDHFEVAAHVRDAHVGLVTDTGEPTESDIRDAVRTVLGAEIFGTAAAAIAERIATMPNPAAVLHQLHAHRSAS